MPPADRYELCSRLLFGPGTWFELCREATGDPTAAAGLARRLAPGGDAALALATRNTWPGESRLRPPAGRAPGPARSAAQAAADVVAALTAGTGAEDLLRSAAAHWHRANVLPVLPLTGAGIDVGPAEPRAAVVARRLAVLADEPAPQGTAAYGMVALLARALTGAWPARRRGTQVPVLFDRRSTGGHGALRLTLLDAGPPGLYPDPRAMLFLVADERFAAALDVAWRTAGSSLAGRCVAWRLTTDDLPCDEVAGGSLGAAFGVALTELARRTPPPLRVRRPDRRCAITAGLRPDLRLSPVAGVPNKLEEAVRQRLRVVLAPPADRESLPAALLHDARVRFAADLPAAVRQSRTRVNPTLVAMVLVLALAAAGVTGGLLAAARESREAHRRDVAAGLLPAAAALRNADPAGALLLEALAVQLDGPGARAALIRGVLANRYAGVLAGPDNHGPCGGPQTWSPDGTRVITVRRETVRATPGRLPTVRNDVLLWDTGRRVIDRRIGFTGQVSGCAFSPDGRTLALAVDDRLVLVPLGGPASSGPHPPVGDVPVQQVQFAPNGLLATAAGRQPVRLWSVADPRRPSVRGTVAATVSRLNPADPPLLAFSRDSRTLVFGEPDRVVLADVGRPGRPRIAGSIPVAASSLALSAKGVLAIGRTDGGTELWDARAPGGPLRTDRLPAQDTVSVRVGSVGFTPGGRTLVVATATSQVWRLDDTGPRRLRVLAATQHQVTSADLAPDGETALVHAADGTSSLWRVAGLGNPPAVAALPLGRSRVTGLAAPSGTTRLVVTAAGGAVTVWDLGDPARPRRVSATGPRDGAGTVGDPDRPSFGTDTSPTAFTPDGRRFAATDGAGGVGVWTVDPDGRPRRTGAIPRVGEDGIAPLALSPDGSLLAVRPSEQDPDRAEPVSLWDVGGDPRPVGRLPATDRAPAMTFAPDGRTLVTVSLDDGPKRVTWWDVADPARATPRVARDLPAVEGTPGPVVFTPDGRRTFVTAGTGPGVVWDTSDPASPALLTAVPPTSGSEAYGAVLRGPALVLSGQGAASVWDVADPAAASEAAVLDSGDENAFFFDHLAVTRDGLLAATHFAEGLTSYYTREALVRLWDLRPILDVVADPVAAACRIAGRDLAPQLWRRHAPGLQARPICR